MPEIVTGLTSVRLAELSRKIDSHRAVTGEQDQHRHMRKASDHGKDTESAPRSILSMFHVCHMLAAHQILNIYEASRSASVWQDNLTGDPQVRQARTCTLLNMHASDLTQQGYIALNQGRGDKSNRSESHPIDSNFKISGRREQLPRLSTLPAPDDNTESHLFCSRSSQKFLFLPICGCKRSIRTFYLFCFSFVSASTRSSSDSLC